MSELSLLMCCHKQYDIIPPLWEPIQCGAALNPPVEGALSDSGGDNISLQNRVYCELTAHYYAWKNIDAAYYGFCHYRRFWGMESCTKRPYLALGELPESKRVGLLGDEKYWRELISDNAIIVPRSEDMGLAVREHYCTSAYHYKEDLDIFVEILEQLAPQLKETTQEYLSQSRQYFCNMFIMDTAHFNEYSGILFPVLAEFDRRKTPHGDFQSDRVDGYLGELFTGIYINHCRKNGARIKELPRLDVNCSRKKRLGYALFPPESRRRFVAKKLAKKLRGK